MLIEREKGLFSIEDLTFTTAAPESEEAQEVIRSLSQIPKTLNPKYFYDQLGSQLFEQICLFEKNTHPKSPRSQGLDNW